MNKMSVIPVIAAVSLMTAGTVFAQATVQSDTRAQLNTGGLGKGLNTMVRSILGDTESAQAKLASPPAEPSLMMQMNAAADVQSAGSPQARSMSFEASNADAAVVAMSDGELSAYVRELLLADSNLQSIDTSDTHVRVTYAVPSKVLRFVNVTLRITVSANAAKTTEVVYPWYAGLASNVRTDFKRRAATEIDGLIPNHPFTPDEQRELIDRIHVMLAGEFGPSSGGDR